MIYNLQNCLFAQYLFIYLYTCTLYHLVEFSLSIVIIHSTFHIIIALSHFFSFRIIVSMLHASYNLFHFTCFLEPFQYFFCFITSYVLCLACIFQEVDNGYNLYVPEGTIPIRDSDLYLYDLNEAAIMIQTGSMSSTQTGPRYL